MGLLLNQYRKLRILKQMLSVPVRILINRVWDIKKEAAPVLKQLPENRSLTFLPDNQFLL